MDILVKLTKSILLFKVRKQVWTNSQKRGRETSHAKAKQSKGHFTICYLSYSASNYEPGDANAMGGDAQANSFIQHKIVHGQTERGTDKE